MKKKPVLFSVFFACATLFAEIAAPAESFQPIQLQGIIGKDHIQGICCSDNFIYASQAGRLYQFSWNGKIVRTVPSIVHTGDICFWKGRVYTSVACKKDGVQRGKIQVFDENLNRMREENLPSGTDGIAILNGTIYLGMGANAPVSKVPHRENFIGRFDAETLKPLKQKEIFDFGYPTSYGVQDMTSCGGRYLLISFYPGTPAGPGFAICDKELKILKVLPKFTASSGLDLLPGRLRDDRFIFLRTNPKKNQLEFYEFDPGTLNIFPAKKRTQSGRR